MIFMNGKTQSMTDYKRGTLIFAFLMFTMLPAAANAESGASTTPFTAGNARLSLGFGGATAFNRNYSIFAVGGGYFIADGIEIGLDAEQWSGNSPRIEQVSPQARMVLNTAGSLKPYVGAFYRRTFIEGYRDHDTIGARAGVYFLAGRSAYFGAGLAEDVHLNCDRTVYASCTETYPELLFAILF
jgi:hypothetical protein